jgi:pentapeptide repeat protein
LPHHLVKFIGNSSPVVIVVVMVGGTDRHAAKGEEVRKPWTLREVWGKPIWDWLDLLIVPAALLLIGGVFTAVQNLQQQAYETERVAHEQLLADQRADGEALQAYLDQMNSLLLQHNLRTSGANSDTRKLARARTLTVLASIEPSLKGQVMQFLVEANLVQSEPGEESIIRLSGADLSDADLSGADLSGADLSCRVEATKYGTFVLCADLSGTDLINANLSGTKLSGADLSDADLSGALVSLEQLEQAKSLEGATMPNGQKYEEWLKSKDSK